MNYVFFFWYFKWNLSTERNAYYLIKSPPVWWNHQPNKFKPNPVHSPLKPIITKLNAAFRSSPLQDIIQAAVLKTTMSCPPKSEPARERDPRKTPNVASRWCCGVVVVVKPKLFLFKIHHSEATMLERITRSIQLLKMKILKYPSQRYILETYEVAFNYLLPFV